MIYFQPTVTALQSHIADLQQRLAASETERQQLLDRLLMKANFTPIASPDPQTAAKLPLQYIAPPGVNPVEIQDGIRDVWLQEEMGYLMNELGYDPIRARNQAERAYDEQHGITH